MAERQAVNAAESIRVADAFLAPPSLEDQYRFLREEGKQKLAAMFWVLWKTHPVWSRLKSRKVARSRDVRRHAKLTPQRHEN